MPKILHITASQLTKGKKLFESYAEMQECSPREALETLGRSGVYEYLGLSPEQKHLADCYDRVTFYSKLADKLWGGWR